MEVSGQLHNSAAIPPPGEGTTGGPQSRSDPTLKMTIYFISVWLKRRRQYIEIYIDE
jgi:hypothetical protein